MKTMLSRQKRLALEHVSSILKKNQRPIPLEQFVGDISEKLVLWALHTLKNRGSVDEHHDGDRLAYVLRRKV